MTTPPVPQWAVDAAKEHYYQTACTFDGKYEQQWAEEALARIIAALGVLPKRRGK